MLCSTPELTALNWVQERRELCPISRPTTPHGPIATGLINLLENRLMISTFLLVCEQHRQVNAGQVNRHNASARAVSRPDIDQQCLLSARQVDVHVSQQGRIEQGTVQAAGGIVNPQTSAQRI